MLFAPPKLYRMNDNLFTRHSPWHLISVFSFTLLLPVAVHAFSGTEGASFLELPIGARPAALGSAYSMLAEDAYAPTWNPAGLAFLTENELAGMHVAYLESTSYEYGSFVHPLGNGRGIGASVQYFLPGTIAALDANGNSIGDFTGYYANYTLAYGQAIGQNLSLGISGNFIQAKIADATGDAFAGTAGLLCRPNAQWRLAAVVANAGQKLTLLNAGDSLPLVYRLGAAYHPIPSWTLALEGAQQQNGLSSLHTGVEYETPFGFTFRSGYNTERTRQLSQVAGLSFGVSMLVWKQDLSYTWLPMSDLGSTHLISLVLHFGHAGSNMEDTHKLERPPAADEMDLNVESR